MRFRLGPRDQNLASVKKLSGRGTSIPLGSVT